MSDLNGLYYKVTQTYLWCQGEKRKLIRERDKINARLGMLEEIMIDLNDVLCKHGEHIYEHFEEEKKHPYSDLLKEANNDRE